MQLTPLQQAELSALDSAAGVKPVAVEQIEMPLLHSASLAPAPLVHVSPIVTAEPEKVTAPTVTPAPVIRKPPPQPAKKESEGTDVMKLSVNLRV